MPLDFSVDNIGRIDTDGSHIIIKGRIELQFLEIISTLPIFIEHILQIDFADHIINVGALHINSHIPFENGNRIVSDKIQRIQIGIIYLSFKVIVVFTGGNIGEAVKSQEKIRIMADQFSVKDRVFQFSGHLNVVIGISIEFQGGNDPFDMRVQILLMKAFAFDVQAKTGLSQTGVVQQIAEIEILEMDFSAIGFIPRGIKMDQPCIEFG